MRKHLSILEFLALAWLACLVSATLIAGWLPLSDPLSVDLGQILHHPVRAHLGGTDQLGRDVLSRVVFAARSTLIVTTGATALSLLLGTALGVTAGYWSGLPDRLIGFFIDLLWSVP